MPCLRAGERALIIASGTFIDEGVTVVSVQRCLRGGLGLILLLTLVVGVPTAGALEIAAPDSPFGSVSLRTSSAIPDRVSLVEDDDIPGVSLAASPFDDSLDAALDMDDVYAVELAPAQYFYLEIVGPADADFDIIVFGPGSTSVNSESGIVDVSISSGSNESVMIYSEDGGTYYFDIYADAGSGSYTLSYGYPYRQSEVSLTAPSTIAYGATASLKGVLLDDVATPWPGATVHLFSRAAGAVIWNYVGAATTNTEGAFAFAVKPGTKTSYIAVRLGDAEFLDSLSPMRTVAPRAWLSAPVAPTVMSKYKTYSVTGFMRPRHAVGTYPVRIYKYRYVSGAWKSYGYVKAKASNYSTYTKYTGAVRLPYPGKWRLRAYHPVDAGHSSGWSTAYDYVTVR